MAQLGDIHWYAGDPPAYHGGAWELCVKRHDLARGAQWGGPILPDNASDGDYQAAWDDLAREWWETTMPEVVRRYGLNPEHIGQDGHEGGWLVHYKRGALAYIEDLGGIDGYADGATWRQRVKNLCAALVASMPSAADLMARIAAYRDARLEGEMARGTVCPSCGEIIVAVPMMVAAR